MSMCLETPSSCKSHLCDKHSVGIGHFTGLPLCQGHLDKDIQFVEEKKNELVQKLQSVVDSERRSLLRAEQSSLEAELQEVNDAFDALQAHVQQWRESTVSRVQAAHDSVASRLRDAAEADECNKELSEASDAGDWKKVMMLTSSYRMWIDDACERSEQFDRARSDLFRRQKKTVIDDSNLLSIRSVGDVSSGVRHLQFIIDRHMNDVMLKCWLDVENSEPFDEAQRLLVCQSFASIENLPGGPSCLAVCTNTAGFVGDSSGYVARAEPADSVSVPLPQPCVFVVFSNDEDPEVAVIEHIFVASLDGSSRLQCRLSCTFDWNENVWDLHCDSERQLLYVSQSSSITVVDLSGKFVQIIEAGKFNDFHVEFGFIDGNEDKLCTFCNSNIVSLAKSDHSICLVDSGLKSETESFLDVRIVGNHVRIIDQMLLKIHVLCRISGQWLCSYPMTSTSLEEYWNPNGLAVDSRGLMFVSDLLHQTVRVVDYFGTTLQTIGTESQTGTGTWKCFCSPGALCVVELPGSRRLVVSDEQSNRLLVFDVL